jgi:hypothetical protein
VTASHQNFLPLFKTKPMLSWHDRIKAQLGFFAYGFRYFFGLETIRRSCKDRTYEFYLLNKRIRVFKKMIRRKVG